MELESLLGYFRSTFTATEREERYKAENSINRVEKNLTPFEFLTQLFELLLTNGQSIETSIKLSISVRIKQTIEKAMKNNSLSLNEKLQTLEKLVDFVTESNITISLILFAIDSEELILQSINPNNEFINNLDKTFEKLATKIDKQNNHEGEPGFLQLMISIVSTNSLNENNFEKIVSTVIKYAKYSLQTNLNHLKSRGFPQNNFFLQEKELYFVNEIAKLTGIFKLLNDIITQTLKKKLTSKYKFVYDNIIPFIKEEGALILFHKTNDLIICWTNKSLIDQKVNILKIRILRIIAVIFTLITNIQNLDNQDIPFFKDIIQNIAFDLTSIINKQFNGIENLPLNCEKIDRKNSFKLEYSRMIYQYLSILSKFLSIPPFLENYQNDFKMLFKDVLLPLLIITKSEKSMMTQSSEFNIYDNYFEDVITKRKGDSIKTGAAMLLLTLFNSLHTLKYYILKYNIILFENCLAQLCNNTIPPSINNDIVNNDDKICVLLKNNYEHMLDLTLMVLLIVADSTQNELKSPGIVNQVFQSITQRLGLLFHCDVIHVKHKFLIFLNKFEKLISVEDKNSQNYVSQYLLNHLLKENNQLLKKESVCILTKHLTSLEISKETLTEHLLSFSKQIEFSHEPEFFELFYDIKIKVGPSDIDLLILTALCQKTNLEIKKYLNFKQGKSKNKHIIIKCFNIIREMFTSKYGSFIQNNGNEISKIITPLFQYACRTKTFNDEYMFILSNMIRYMKKIPSLNIDIIQYILTCSQRVNCLNNYLFHLINHFLIYFVPSNESEQILFINFLNKVSSIVNHQKENILSPFYMTTLIQTFVLNKCNIPEDVIEKFLNETVTNLRNLLDLNKLTIFQEYYFACNLALVFMSFKQNDKLISAFVLNDGQEMQIKNWCCKLLTFINYSNFHIKSIILSLTLLFQKIGLRDEVFFFIEFGYKLLIKQYLSEKEQRIKSIPKEKHDRPFKGDYDSENEDEFKIEEGDCNEFEKSEEEKLMKEMNEFQMNVYDPEIEGKDEFIIFTQCVEKLKNYNELKFNEWINSLNETDREKFKNISNVKRRSVQITEDGYTKEILFARRIVQIKRNVNENNV